jgi:polyhydroxyalkanoate synthase subunit PhaC
MVKKHTRRGSSTSERDGAVRSAFAAGFRAKKAGVIDKVSEAEGSARVGAAFANESDARSVKLEPKRAMARLKKADGASADAVSSRRAAAKTLSRPPLAGSTSGLPGGASTGSPEAKSSNLKVAGVGPLGGAGSSAPQAEKGGAGAAPPRPDFHELAANLGRLVDETTRATNAFLKPRLAGESSSLANAEITEMTRTLGMVAEHWLAEPGSAVEAQTRLTSGFVNLWADALRRFRGEEVPAALPRDPRDARFRDAAWTDNPFFDFVRQAHAHAGKWAEDMVKEAKGIDAHTRHKAEFYVRQIASAFAPSNFLALNPELIRQTIEQNGANLVRGAHMLAEDIEAGGGELKLRQTDATNFEVGVNLATTPGKVVFRNDLIELIQYAPSTETVLKRPLLIVPPWINKFYILDLNPEKSFIRWAVAQGLTVFVVSWVNPDERHADRGFDAYMREGIFAALDAVEAATGEQKITAIGYCVGGTLLSATLGYMAAKGDRRIESATLFTTQVDFTHAGDLQVFVDEGQVRAIEEEMRSRGFLEGRRMATAFNMLRPNDLIWRYVVDVYLKGRSPMPFDLLFWNSDSTRMPAANHSFYLRNCYMENNLSQGRMVIDGVTIDLSKVTIPIYNLAAKEDHIAPALSAFEGSRCFAGEVRYVMAGSGHIAGVVNPPDKHKYQYWTGGPAEGSFADWIKRATEHKGSWWPDWFSWIERQAPKRVAAREPGGGRLIPLCDAPGTYVKAKA